MSPHHPHEEVCIGELRPSQSFASVFRNVTYLFQLPTSLYHSLMAHHSLQGLLYPPFVLHDSKMYASKDDAVPRESPESRDSYSAVSAALPCDLQLLTIRPLPDDPNSRLMIAHRPGIDCSLPVGSETACKSSSKVGENIAEKLTFTPGPTNQGASVA